MSRIGKQPIAVPSGVEVKLNDKDSSIDVKGPKGNLSFSWREEVNVQHDEEQRHIACSVANKEETTRQANALWGNDKKPN